MTKTIQRKTRRCRSGACIDLALPPASHCVACRRIRIASKRQRLAAGLAKATHCQVASDINRGAAP